MAIATGLIPSLINVKMYLFTNGSIPPMLLPKVTFVLHSFLHYRIGDDLWYARYGFSVRLAELAGVLLTPFLVWNVN